MKKTSSIPFLAELLPRIAPKIGAKVLIEPKWKHVGQILFKNGKKKYFRHSSIDLNSMGAMEIAQDKDYAKFFMKKLGFPTIEGKTFYSYTWAKAIGSKDDLEKAFKYAEKIGFPVIVKPNSKSQGVGVSLIFNREEFYTAMKDIFTYEKVVLVERVVCGRDYRIVVLDDKVLSAYERIPLSILGDGKSSIKNLLLKKQIEFKKSGRDTFLNIDDQRIYRKLEHGGLTFDFVPKKEEKIFLLDNANLSTGGDSRDVTNKIHDDWKKLATKLTKEMGLRFCGVDLMIDGDITKPILSAKNYWVIEINSAPGLDHYAKSGAEQEKIVENLYLEVLKGMER